ncbi:glycosyltransferase family 4 protein [Gramella lutea]|uniref:Glycosyltransferase family 4 protein n=1 Tax=Christiangramia lutea TaxID=1607951 RepID=A0A9X1V2H9_9FLAO|nr:glycosyltransferase family 4 protein [Christiangramia lutea]MCH4821588.1 glycosyltransferase family 4 protein [Christiangramia lutea]
MSKNVLNIALLTPTNISYSETFIQAHKKLLNGKVYHYYGSIENQHLDGYGQLRGHDEIKHRLRRLIKRESHTRFLERFIEESFRDKKIDVVLAEYGDTAIPYLPVLKRLNLPLIVHFHGYDASIHKMFELTNNYKEIFEYASYVVVVSTKMRKDIIKIGCPEKKLIYNVYGPRDEFLKVTPRFSKKQFMAAGRFVDKKAPYYLILAFKEVVKEFPRAKLIIAGDGNLFQTCKNLIKFFGLENNISLPGVISSEDLRDYFTESIAFVQHSITAEHGDSEGTPLTILEASAAGLPVIATRHAGIPDVIIDQKTGLLSAEHDVASMAGNMLKILNEESAARELGAAGKINISDNFTLAHHIGRLDELFDEAIESKPLS